MLDVQPRRGTEGYWTVRRRFPLAPRSAARRFAGGGRLDDSAANRRPRSHCLHASHWIVIFEGVERRTTTATAATTTCTLCAAPLREAANQTRSRSENKGNTRVRARARATHTSSAPLQAAPLPTARTWSGYQAHTSSQIKHALAHGVKIGACC